MEKTFSKLPYTRWYYALSITTENWSNESKNVFGNLVEDQSSYVLRNIEYSSHLHYGTVV